MVEGNAFLRIMTPSVGTSKLSRAITSENWKAVRFQCVHNPKKAQSWTKCPGFFDGHRTTTVLPLHQACVFSPPKLAILALIRAYPAALKARETGYKRMPLHIACHSGNISDEIVSLLLLHYPDAATVPDVVGRVPLHYACSNGASSDVIQMLLEAGPTAAQAADYNGWLPIHVACRVGASTDVIRMLIHAFPDAAEKATHKGNTPSSLLRVSTATNRHEVKKLIKDIINEQNNDANLALLMEKDQSDTSKSSLIENEVEEENESPSTLPTREDGTTFISSLDEENGQPLAPSQEGGRPPLAPNCSHPVSDNSRMLKKIVVVAQDSSIDGGRPLISSTSSFRSTCSTGSANSATKNPHATFDLTDEDAFLLSMAKSKPRGSLLKSATYMVKSTMGLHKEKDTENVFEEMSDSSVLC